MKIKPPPFKQLSLTCLKACKSHRFWSAIALFTFALLLTVGPLKVLFNQDFLVEQLDMFACCAAILFILIYTVITVAGVPGTILTIAGGVVFGLAWGTLWSVLGATLGAMGAFWTARYLLHDWIEKRFGQQPMLIKFKQAVRRYPFSFVLAVRFVPITPFNAINFAFGLTPIHWLPYSFATLIGIIPGTFAYTWLGVSGSAAIQGGDRLPFFLALGLLVLLSVLPIYVKKMFS
ncbi:MAG: TVP38/TMEM64 family protein [Cyanophyceae cyanobacterium]